MKQLMLILIGICVFLCILAGMSSAYRNAINPPTPVAQAQTDVSAGAKAMPKATNTSKASNIPQSTSTPKPPEPTPTIVLVVTNTGGDGVFIRKSPTLSDKIKVWKDDTVMTVIGADQDGDGKTWKNVQDPDNNAGWIPADYLAIPTPTPKPTPTVDKSRYKLELLSSNGFHQYGYSTVEGQVKNISSSSLRNVEVVVEWYTNNNEFVKSDSALIEYNPILPGQTSPFKSMTTYNPAMAKYQISGFKELMGGAISTLDSIKR